MSKDLLVNCRALVVDDDPMLRNVLKRWLTRSGMVVDEAEDGEDAERQLRAGSYEIVVSDIDMPRMSGLTLARRLRSDAKLKHLGLLLITGDTTARRQLEALDSGADDFVGKPFQGGVLIARVRMVVARRRAERQTEESTARLSRYLSSAALKRRRSDVPVESVEVTVMFSDLRGFTSTSERVEPTTLFEALSEVLAKQVELVRKHGGYVDKFSGDGLLAVFEGDSAEIRACLAAHETVLWAHRIQGIGPWSPPPIGFGIHTGTVMRGDLGSVERREFTVIGPVVNAAARLCGVAAALEVVVSAPVAKTAVEQPGSRAVVFDSKGEVALKGMARPMAVFRARGAARAESQN